MRRCFASVFALAGLMLGGCSKEDDTTSVTPLPSEIGKAKTDGDHAGHQHDSNSPKIDAEKLKRAVEIPERKTLNGRWLVSSFRVLPPTQQNQLPQFGETSDIILDVTLDPNDAKLNDVSIIASRGDVEQRSIKVLKLSETDIELDVMAPGGKVRIFNFQGRLIQSRVIGSILTSNNEILPMRLIPTEERTFARVMPFTPFEEQEDFMKLEKSPAPDDDTEKFAEQHKLSPLSRFAYLQLIQMLAVQKAKESELVEQIDNAVKAQELWGKRLQDRLILEVSQALVTVGYDVVATENILARAEEVMKNSELAALGGDKAISVMRDNIKLRRAIELLDAKDPEARSQGREVTRKFLKDYPFHPTLMWKLADEARDSKLTDDALRLFAELTVLPGQEALLQQTWAADPVKRILPSERVGQLYKEKHGNVTGLDAYLEQVYQESLLSFVGDAKAPARKEGANKNVLIELFTGARCPQCLCADVGIMGLQKVYPATDVFVLRYHEHIPGQDPLTNEDGESRMFNFYKRSGTPTMFINGTDTIGVGGPIMRLREVFPDLRKFVEKQLEETVKTKIELKVTREGDEISVDCEVTGEDFADGNKRLRFAVAESEVHFKAANGIRHHSMVVRQLLNGGKGLPVKESPYSYKTTTNVAKLRVSLNEYLAKYEKNQSVELPEKPLDLKSLVVVAFVQDDDSKLVLQSALTPVP